MDEREKCAIKSEGERRWCVRFTLYYIIEQAKIMEEELDDVELDYLRKKALQSRQQVWEIHGIIYSLHTLIN